MSYLVDMHSTPSGIIANQVRRRRRQLDITRQQLAEKCASVGAPQLTLAALTNIETGRPDSQGMRRRDVTVEELLALACVLETNPVDLMVPGDAPDDEPYSVTAAVSTTSAVAREWISGRAFLIAPETPMDFAIAIQAMPKARAEEMARKWFGSGRDPQSRVNEWNRQTNAWQAANEPEPRSMTDVIVDAASVAADPTAVIKQMVAGPPLTLVQVNDDSEEDTDGE